MLRNSVLRWLAGVLVVVLVAGAASAQRDSGAKARGEFGTGFWNSRSDRSGSTSRAQSSRSTPDNVYTRRQPSQEREVYARRPSQEREYRVSSYEPTPFAVGDTVTIAKEDAQVMRGSQRVGTLEKGHEFKVLRVANGWLGTVVDEGGQNKGGWVWHQNVKPVAATSEPDVNR